MNVSIKLEFDWLHQKVHQAIADSNDLTNEDDALIGEVLAHLVAAQTEMKAAIAAIAAVKQSKAQQRKAG